MKIVRFFGRPLMTNTAVVPNGAETRQMFAQKCGKIGLEDDGVPEPEMVWER